MNGVLGRASRSGQLARPNGLSQQCLSVRVGRPFTGSCQRISASRPTNRPVFTRTAHRALRVAVRVQLVQVRLPDPWRPAPKTSRPRSHACSVAVSLSPRRLSTESRPRSRASASPPTLPSSTASCTRSSSLLARQWRLLALAVAGKAALYCVADGAAEQVLAVAVHVATARSVGSV